MLIKGTKAHRRKVGSAWLIVYTTHLIRAELDLQDHVPILSVLGLPLDMVRARVKFWSGTDGTKLFTRQHLSVPNQFFWYASFFYPSRTKNFLQCKWALSHLLPARSCRNYLRSNCKFVVPICKTNRYLDSFIISHCTYFFTDSFLFQLLSYL